MCETGCLGAQGNGEDVGEMMGVNEGGDDDEENAGLRQFCRNSAAATRRGAQTRQPQPNHCRVCKGDISALLPLLFTTAVGRTALPGLCVLSLFLFIFPFSFSFSFGFDFGSQTDLQAQKPRAANPEFL